MSEKIRGKVARILDTRNLVLNVGSSSGVLVGMYFDVLDPNGDNITDPDTGEILGSLERPKIRLQVVRTEFKLSIASTFKKTTVNVGGNGGYDIIGLASVFSPPKYVTKYETLKTTEKTWEDLKESDSFVKIGDPVIQVIEEIDVGQNDSE